MNLSICAIPVLTTIVWGDNRSGVQQVGLSDGETRLFIEMRLDEAQQQAIDYAVKHIDEEVYLFGSRVDDNGRGGDIDLLIFSGGDSYNISREVKRRFFTRCEEKIDVIVMDPDNLTEQQQAFLGTIEKARIK